MADLTAGISDWTMRALAFAGAVLLVFGTEARAAPQAPQGAVRPIVADASGYGGQLALPIGGSRILKFSQPIGKVMVGDPKVADVIPLTDRTVYVLGKAAGASSLTVLGAAGSRPIATLDLKVGFDLEALRRALHDIMPGEALEISSEGDGLVLSGIASSSAAAARAQALAEQFAPQKVVNLASVRGAEQVMISVHVAEVQRSALQQLGITDLQGSFTDAGAITLPDFAKNTGAIANLIGSFRVGGRGNLQTLFNALESKGYASVLAEPTLTALSGETAVFFAGGEFPVPVPQLNGGGQSQITVIYKQYGVSVAFTPTVYGDTINLLVAPEVSALDKENSVNLQGFTIPGLTTRRAKTTVELRNGESFAIAGLIKRDFSDSLRGLPGATRLPLFGALFRSTAYANNETEVVIIVTAHLAKPTQRTNLLLPTDTRHAPGEAELYLGPTVDKPNGPTRSGAAPGEGPKQ
ncbi:type II and III secretion system protein family protein [Phenylobacterium sp.]|uniref:type II and III secretion system protein family protein n=1 Tax=Phenylobacterium sp. TaxID=1871053 RepID=UPI002DE3CEC0|nr:type II and III secretion system protein family protein [Phenylobacterium sp.]